MVQLNISSGQGITQALAQNLGLSKEDCKKIGAQNWQTAVNDINSMNSSIFKSQNNDVTKIGDKSQNHSNFVVDAGTVEIDDSVFAKVKNFLLSLVGRGENKTDSTNVEDKTANVKSEQNTSKPETAENTGVKPEVTGQKEEIASNKLDFMKFNAADLKASLFESPKINTPDKIELSIADVKQTDAPAETQVAAETEKPAEVISEQVETQTPVETKKNPSGISGKSTYMNVWDKLFAESHSKSTIVYDR